MLVKMKKGDQEALLQAGTESHAAYLNDGWTQEEVVEEDAEVPAIGTEPNPAEGVVDTPVDPAPPVEGDPPADPPTETGTTRRSRG